MGLFSKKQNPNIISAANPNVDRSEENVKNLSKLAIELIREGVVLIDEKFNILLLNKAAERLLGVNHEFATGLHYGSSIKLFTEDDKTIPDEKNPIFVALQNGEPRVLRNLKVNNAKTGANTEVELNITPISEDQTGDGVIVTLRDIEKQLKEEREQSDFIATASHEMRTPVASIEGYLAMALNPKLAVIDDKAREYLDKAHKSAKHLGKLFADLLDTTNLEDRKLLAHPELRSINPIIQDSVDSQAPIIAEKGLTIQFKTNDATSKEYLAYTDESFLREIVDGLIENAVKYTPQGGIIVSVNADATKIYISVADSGMGISEDDQKHIFQKFYRSDNSDTRTIGGTGLGLYIAAERAKALQGTLSVKSELGRGSIFTLAIPRARG